MIEQLIKFKIGLEAICLVLCLAILVLYPVFALAMQIIREMKEQEDGRTGNDNL